jgi:hypothetical protein
MEVNYKSEEATIDEYERRDSFAITVIVAMVSEVTTLGDSLLMAET